MRAGTLSLNVGVANTQNSVLSKNAYSLAIFNFDWYLKTRLVCNSVFTPSAVVTPMKFAFSIDC